MKPSIVSVTTGLLCAAFVAFIAPPAAAARHDKLDVIPISSTAIGKTVASYYKVMVIIDRVDNGGRKLRFKDDGTKASAGVSRSKTKVIIGGKKAKRSAIKAGMTCVIDYQGSGSTARAVYCE